PFFLDVFAPDLALNDGLNASAAQLPTANGVDSDTGEPSVVPTIPVTEESVVSPPQNVGFWRKPCLLTVTTSFRRRTTIPPWTIVGSSLETMTRALSWFTLIAARVTVWPRLNGPATLATTIDMPNGAPW